MIARVHFRRLLCVITVALASLGWASAALADVPRDPPPQGDTLQAVLDRIHLHAKDEAWQQDGLKDAVIDKWLEKLLASVAKGAEQPDLKVPVKLADVQPADPARLAINPGSLIVGKDFGRILGARNSIILADGNIEVGIPHDSVIIARGVVRVSGARNCVIVSGTYITSTHDGEPGGGGGSLLVSRGWINVGSAHGSIIVAGEGVSAGRSENALFVNRPVPGEVDRFPRHNGSRSVKAPDLPLEPLPTHALAAKIKLLGLIQGQQDPAARFGPASRSVPVAGALFRFADRRYVAEPGQPIVDEAGQPIADLEGWKLSYAGDNLAIFQRGESEAVVRMDAK